ncbi:putative ATP-dependent helicase [Paenibacillus chitinolyticus]|uniref:ATP-dependent DNA helicase n=1 Tax=Paenibacillus chitinolyticus TaxID=79263 RepID=UPI0026E4D9B1|nr:ATP-dependent DNA helicase [Paenibacillus chitinolyticus]GKS12873.1 putative ATP-dependent helicase [Paenibacillus chitinolyticus]
MEEFIQRTFGVGGHLSKLVKGYSPRAPQILITTKVGYAFERGEHLLCEAGTGTGKSLGYLAPAARWAVENKKTVIVCTHTIPLMNQIVNVELPRVEQILKFEDLKLRYQLVKGKDHYICLTKLERLWQEKLLDSDPESKLIQKIYKKVNKDRIGDRTALGFDVDDTLWKKISASMCPAITRPDSCMLEELKGRMHKAHIIVTNFAFFFNDLKMRIKTGNGSLPPYNAVIFDEAHEIEEVCCHVFEKRVGINQFESLFENLYRRRAFNDLDQATQLELSQLRQLFLRKMEDVYRHVAKNMSDEEGRPTAFKLLTNKVDLSEVCSVMGAFIDKIKNLKLRGVSDILERLFEGNDNLDFIGENEKKSWAYWATIEGRGNVTLHAAPLYPKVILAKALFEKVPVILASATISTTTATGKTFNFYAGRMGVKEYSSIIVDSPFDYLNKTMIICPDDAPDPNSEDYSRYLVDKLEEILMYTTGRTLVLFTSFETMNFVAQKLRHYCDDSGIDLLIQHPGCDREKIIQSFKAEPQSILLGCSSFWTGVDVPGDALTTVVIAKLPFPQPNEPLIQAQLAVIEGAKRSGFFDYLFPKMVVKLKQGFGRLNRSMHCQGAVVILDNRILTKRYGKMIIKNLPKCQYSTKVEDLIKIIPC